MFLSSIYFKKNSFYIFGDSFKLPKKKAPCKILKKKNSLSSRTQTISGVADLHRGRIGVASNSQRLTLHNATLLTDFDSSEKNIAWA